MTKTVNLHASLKQFFGFTEFKGDQERIIESLLAGNDTFVIMPTGGGKSMCYQLPALISDGTAIVISPLIALMKNQVDQIRSYHSDEGIAHYLNSSLTKKQAKKVMEDISSGLCKILYVAPETLVKSETIEFFKKETISFVAVDEAHCISEWGHDFRPEYRRIKEMISALEQKCPIIALTATATPKVQSDVVKNLTMDEANIFISSFLRDNLYYEVRPKGKKEHVTKQLVQFVNSFKGKSGVIYALNRKTTEELAELLRANDINAAAYHAGLDSGVRGRVQDAFIMDDVDVICATIAFGMGIDKPDVRFVVHYDIPKSLENYYQETGRGGRDGLPGSCLSFFSFKDINKLEKFLKDKPVAEKEVSGQHLMEVVSYAESTACRRKFLLHYFGENYSVPKGGCGHCDNCLNPKERIEVKTEALKALLVIKDLKENFTIPHLVNFMTGSESQQIKLSKHNEHKDFGIGKEHDKTFWNSVLRNMLLDNLITKDIEKYGIIKLNKASHDFLAKPHAVQITVNNNYENAHNVVSEVKPVVLDEALVKQLLEVRKSVAKDVGLPPAIIFLENSLNEMALNYPISIEELSNISGVNASKAKKYGQPFVDVIKKYVSENDVERPDDFIVKSSQQIDKKMTFEEIEKNLKLSRQELMEELQAIIASGTKLNIDYYLNDQIDEDSIDIIMEYFAEAENILLDDAVAELEDEGITYEEIELVRIKFYSDVAN